MPEAAKYKRRGGKGQADQSHNYTTATPFSTNHPPKAFVVYQNIPVFALETRCTPHLKTHVSRTEVGRSFPEGENSPAQKDFAVGVSRSDSMEFGLECVCSREAFARLREKSDAPPRRGRAPP